MENQGKLDLNAIAGKCNFFEGFSEEIIQNISDLEKDYNQADLMLIYSYILSTSKNPDVLMHIIQICDKYRDKSLLNNLLDLLLWKTNDEAVEKEKFVNVRVMCAKAIANLKDTRAVTPLLYCLNNKDENYKIRFACADALGKIGDRYAVAPLIAVVKDEEERSIYLRESAASALGLLGDLRAIDPLVSILESKQGILDKFTFLKERVIEALGKLRLDNNRRVFNALKSALVDESPQVKINAIEALMDSDYENAYSSIKNCLTDSNDEVKKNALIALYNMSGREILDEIIQESCYADVLKMEAVSLIEEYENDNNFDITERIHKELDE